MKNRPASTGNLLLARLRPDESRRLASDLRPVALDFKQVLYEAWTPIDYLYFPERGVLSALTVMDDGSAIEVATFGNEGAAGVPALVGAAMSPNRILAQVPGQAHRMDLAVARRELKEGGQLGEFLLLYHAAFIGQISQSVACNGLHSIQKRCARWLLMTHDRVDEDEFPLTHEFLAIMLGVRRPGVTEVLQALKGKGLIDYSRGSITVHDKPGLEAASCECYRKTREVYDRLFA
jgi:CRP-like cAMP-binding protein